MVILTVVSMLLRIISSTLIMMNMVAGACAGSKNQEWNS